MKNNFIIESWNEKTYIELDKQAKYSRAIIKKKYSGELQGQGRLDYLMAYNESGQAHFTGMEYFEGSLDGLSGRFSMLHEGVFKDGLVESTFQIIKGSANMDLLGLSGSGSFKAGHSMSVDFEFSYSI